MRLTHMMFYREEPVVDWEAQIVIVQFHKSRPGDFNQIFAFLSESFTVNLLEVFCLAKVSCKGISLELKAPAENKDGVSH